MKNILIINANPDKQSFCTELALQYEIGASKNTSKCTLVHLSDLDFDLNLNFGYRIKSELEPDLVKMQELIKEADHLVFVYPNWWGTYPALLKAFIDRVFLPNFAFKYRDGSLLWDKLLSGKSARLIVTMDTPKFFYSLIFRSSGHNSMKKSILNFCGVKPVKISTFSPIKTSNIQQRNKWLEKVKKLGEQLK